jgi:hypothetical protein
MNFKHIAGFVLFGLGTAGLMLASVAPEIDPATGGNALALIAGAVLMIRSRRRR